MNHWIFKLSLLIMLIILNVIPKTILVSVADEIISNEILPHGESNMIDEVLVNTNTNGTVILNEGELYLYDCQFSPVSNQAPIDNIGTLKQEPNYDIEYDGIDYISRL